MKLKLISIILLILIIPTVSAGAGIVYGSEYLKVDEGKTTCMSYGVYNPWNEDANIKVYASGDLTGLAVADTTLEVPANTKHNDAVPVKLCFKVPKVYKEDCIFWRFGCKRDCNEEPKKYSGQILASELLDTSSKSSGSKVTGTVSAPLTIEVKCNPEERNWVSFIALIGMIVLSIISILIWNNYRAPLEERKRKKAERLLKKQRELQDKMRRL